jgi:hypothetical protein
MSKLTDFVTLPDTTITTTVQVATAGQTTFMVDYVVDCLEVHQNGVRLLPSDFTATNGTSVILDVGATLDDELMFSNFYMMNIAGKSGGLIPKAKSASFNATKDTRYICDTTAGSFTATLPALPAVGDYLEFYDAGTTWSTNPVTIGRNGSKINGEM